MMEDLKLRSEKIPLEIKENIFDILLNDSGLLHRQKTIRDSLKKMVICIYKEDIYPKELLDLFNKSRRIADKLRCIRINYKELFNCNDYYYPNDILTIPKLINGNEIRIFMDGNFQLNLENDLELLPDRDELSYEDFINFIDKIDPEKIKLLKYISIDMFKNSYDIENFKGGRSSFLSNVNTFGELYNYNKDYYEIAYKFFNERYKNNKKDIPSLLKNLKNLLES